MGAEGEDEEETKAEKYTKMKVRREKKRDERRVRMGMMSKRRKKEENE